MARPEDEARLRQWAVSGYLLRVVGLTRATVDQMDPLLRRAGVVPISAELLGIFQAPSQDVWMLRYAHETFPVVQEYGYLETMIVEPEMVRTP